MNMTQRYKNFSFKIKAKDGQARVGELKTPHGTIQTPAFVFCGTKAAIRCATIPQMKEANTQIMLGNTYHLMLQPGADLVEKMGGLHKFMGWDGPMFTDSGGYQVFSLNHGSISEDARGERLEKNPKKRVKLTEQGATFRSHIDGSKHLLTPETSVQIQKQLGADLFFVLDEHTALSHSYRYTARSLQLTHRWALRCLAEFDRLDDGSQALYGIVQGGIYEDLRREGAQFIASHGFFGTGLGGCWGRTKDDLFQTYSYAIPHLPPERPIHLLGIGDVEDIIRGAGMGIDTFDCVTPTRHARHGAAIVKNEKKFRLNLNNAKHREDKNPIEDGCGCYTCQHFNRAYVHHLLRVGEPLGYQLVALHNIFFMNRLMQELRDAISAGKYEAFKQEWLGNN